MNHSQGNSQLGCHLCWGKNFEKISLKMSTEAVEIRYVTKLYTIIPTMRPTFLAVIAR